MRKASWILLTVLGAAITLVSFISAIHAYRANDDYSIGPARVSQVAAGDPELTTALRGIRSTSAAFAAAYGVLFLAIVIGPFRRSDVWAWAALLASGFVLVAVAALRIPILGTQHGVAAAATPFAILIVGLLLDIGRLKGADDRQSR